MSFASKIFFFLAVSSSVGFVEYVYKKLASKKTLAELESLRLPNFGNYHFTQDVGQGGAL